MIRRLSLPLLALVLSPLFISPVFAQSLSDRIADLKNRQPKPDADVPRGPSIAMRLSAVIEPVKIENAPAKQAFAWWCKTTGISMVINWDNLSSHGIDPEKPLSLDLHNVPAGTVLSLLMQQAASDQDSLVFESTPWYIHIMAKSEANKINVVRIYDISDLILEIPNFDNAPDFNLTSALSNNSAGGGSSSSSTSSSGSGSGSGTTSLFGSSSTSQTVKAKSEEDRAGQLVDIIRHMIEPTIWDTNGGTASIKYLQGRLIVSAPLYVQRQIGMPSVAPRSAAHSTTGSTTGTQAAKAKPASSSKSTTSGVDESKSAPVSGIAP